MNARRFIVAAATTVFIASGTMALGGSAATAQASGRSIQCDGLTVLGHAPKTKVVVPSGASCTLKNSTVKSVRGLPGAVDVKVYNTVVKRNLMVRHATGTVHIGDRDCGFDPSVGNNIIVRNSHNVLICVVRVRNNVMVRNNDGRITVRENEVRRNIRVNRNLAYAPHADENPPPWAAGIRILHNNAGGHIVARDNASSRRVITRGNNPAVIIA
jgi:hypothetical protein